MIDSSILKLFLIGSNNEGLRSAVEIGLSSTIELINLPATNGFRLRDGLKIPKKYPLGIIPYSYNQIEFKLIKAPSDSAVKNTALGETEVTQELFEAVMVFNPSEFKGMSDSLQRPVENVSWFDCIVFCNRLSQGLGLAPYYSLTGIEHAEYAPQSIKSATITELKGNGFRLPTSAEWESFAKACTTNTWSGTNEEKKLGDYAWFHENSEKQTHPIAQKKPNEWGLYDMIGNVEEWCWDANTSTSGGRVLRGGSWVEYASNLRSADSSNGLQGYCYSFLGFRICRSIG